MTQDAPKRFLSFMLLSFWVIEAPSFLWRSMWSRGRPERESNPDLCDASAVVHQLNYQAHWELVIIWVNVCVTHGLGEDIFLLFFRGTGHVLSGVSSVWSKISLSYNTANTSSIAQSYDFLFSVSFLSFRAPTPTLPLDHFLRILNLKMVPFLQIPK